MAWIDDFNFGYVGIFHESNDCILQSLGEQLWGKGDLR